MEKTAHNSQQAEPRRGSPRARAFVLSVLFLMFFGTLFHPVCLRQYPELQVFSDFRPTSLKHRVRRILSETPLIDGHDDLAVVLRGVHNNHIYLKNFTDPFENGGLALHVDLPRLRKGQNGGAFWSVYAPCPANGSDFSDENYAASVQFTLQQIDVMTRLKEAYPHDFSDALDSRGSIAAFRDGKLISPLGVEGLHQIGNSVANLRRYYDLGVRYSTLTHNCHNIFADAALAGEPLAKSKPYWGGVSPKGRQLIHEMNRLGMLVDLAHVSADTMVDVLGGKPEWEGSKAPVIFSHSSAYALCPHPRNVPDDVLQLVKKTDSLVMVNFSPDFVSCVDSGNENGIPDFFPQNNTLSHVADHVIYIGEQIGYDHVGLGSDFDGILETPKGLEDVSKYPDLIAELLERGVSDEDAGKIAGGNILRVWKDAEDVAARLQAEGQPILEDDLPNLW